MEAIDVESFLPLLAIAVPFGWWVIRREIKAQKQFEKEMEPK
jgi:preprotein translocase subunit YajC